MLQSAYTLFVKKVDILRNKHADQAQTLQLSQSLVGWVGSDIILGTAKGKEQAAYYIGVHEQLSST